MDFIKLVSNVLNSYLLIFIHKFILFVLTANTILIMYLYIYLLKSLYLLGFISVEDIYFNCISTVFIGLVFIVDFIYLFIFIELDLIFLLFNTCTIKFIEGKFYFEGRACYIGKTMPTCII